MFLHLPELFFGFDQMGEYVHHFFPDGAAGLQSAVLREIADGRLFGFKNLSAVIGHLAGKDLEQGGFAGAVDADQPHAIPLLNLQINSVKYGLHAVQFFDSTCLKQHEL